jgi:hypothetical protein
MVGLLIFFPLEGAVDVTFSGERKGESLRRQRYCEAADLAEAMHHRTSQTDQTVER